MKVKLKVYYSGSRYIGANAKAQSAEIKRQNNTNVFIKKYMDIFSSDIICQSVCGEWGERTK